MVCQQTQFLQTLEADATIRVTQTHWVDGMLPIRYPDWLVVSIPSKLLVGIVTSTAGILKQNYYGKLPNS